MDCQIQLSQTSESQAKINKDEGNIGSKLITHSHFEYEVRHSIFKMLQYNKLS